MSSCQIVFGKISSGGQLAGSTPVMATETLTVCTLITTSGTSQQGSATAPSNGYRPVCRIHADIDIYVAFGSDPTASATSGVWVKSGVPEYFEVEAGSKVAVIEK